MEVVELIGVPGGIRTLVCAVKGDARAPGCCFRTSTAAKVKVGACSTSNPAPAINDAATQLCQCGTVRAHMILNASTTGTVAAEFVSFVKVLVRGNRFKIKQVDRRARLRAP
jgi:hypothetical protein